MAEFEKVFTAKEFVDGMKKLPFELKGSFYKNVYPYNCLYNHGDGIYSADCWNLIKAYIWSNGKLPSKAGEYSYAPGKYGLGDWNGATILSKCSDVSGDWENVTPGEFILTADGNHAAIYVGDFKHEWNGKVRTYNVIECTPIWEDGIQATYVDAQGRRLEHEGGSQASAWAKHGKLPWIDYSSDSTSATAFEVTVPKGYDKVVINFK